MTHALLAVLVQVTAGVLSGRWLAGGLVAIGFFFGREHAQAEYRWMDAFGSGRRADLPTWAGFDPAAWTAKSAADALLPVVAVGIIYAMATRRTGREKPN